MSESMVAGAMARYTRVTRVEDSLRGASYELPAIIDKEDDDMARNKSREEGAGCISG
jgi:hypothetical protein